MFYPKINYKLLLADSEVNEINNDPDGLIQKIEAIEKQFEIDRLSILPTCWLKN